MKFMHKTFTKFWLAVSVLLHLTACGQATATVAPAEVMETVEGSGEASAPTTTATQELEDFVEAFNAGDEAALDTFVTERFDLALTMQKGGPNNIKLVLGRIYTEHGRLALREVDSEQPNAITGWLQSEATEVWFHVTLYTQEQADRTRIVRLDMVPDAGPASAQETLEPLSPEDFAALVDAHLDELEAQDLFAGTVLIAHDGDIVLLRALGPINEAGDPNQTDTRIALASTSKMFTATATVQLADRGLLSLDDPLNMYLPDYPEDTIRGITVRNLLNHTSGLGSFSYDDIKPLTTIDQMLLAPIEPAAFPPGFDFRYSNGGYVLLGGVIESASGQTYWDYLQENIFDPAGMTSTGAFEPDNLPENTAYGLVYQSMGVRVSNADLLPARPGPAGDFYTTAEDLLSFALALQNNTLIGPEYTQQMFTPSATMTELPGSTAEYGYGFTISTREDVISIGHAGGFPGISSRFAMYPDLGYTLVILSNYDSVAHVLGNWIDGKLAAMNGG